MAAKTISFPKGKGHLTHNNRDFISKNVVPERTSWNRIYMQESLEKAYEKCFGQALMDYNATQKRKDRRKDNYLKEIENSGNKEKTFYENIVQIGKKEDTPVVDEDGNLNDDNIEDLLKDVMTVPRHMAASDTEETFITDDTVSELTPEEVAKKLSLIHI